MKISVYVASAFSKDHKGGNKAGVVFIENTNTLTTTQKNDNSETTGLCGNRIYIRI